MKTIVITYCIMAADEVTMSAYSVMVPATMLAMLVVLWMFTREIKNINRNIIILDDRINFISKPEYRSYRIQHV
jgi:hypothetical protein